MDIGAGYCGFINNIRGREKHAVDIYGRISEFADEDVNVHVQSCTKLEVFDSDFFDVIFSSNLFEHLTRTELRETLYGVTRILAPYGKLIILQPNFKYCYKIYFDDYSHLKIFTERSLSELLKSYGLNIIEVKPRLLPVNIKPFSGLMCQSLI